MFEIVIWLIGLSGAGKTCIGKETARLLKKEAPNTVFIDGDIFREIMGNDLGHSLEARRQNAQRICRFCQYMDNEGINVLCAILSIFPETRDWMRENVSRYFEIYIKTPIEILIERDSKGLYEKALAGEIKDVVGIDMKFPEPENPDLVIENDKLVTSFEAYAEMILKTIKQKA